MVQLKKQLVAAIGAVKNTRTMTYLLKLALQPIESTRHAALNVLRALAAQPTGWGLQMLFQHSSAGTTGGPLHDNFFSYLQERLTEYSKEGKDWKFALILAVAQNPTRAHLATEANDKIDLLVRQGAYFLLPRMAEMQTMEL